jgi:monoamine oxidase
MAHGRDGLSMANDLDDLAIATGVQRRRFLKSAALSTVGVGLGLAARGATVSDGHGAGVLDVAIVGAGISGLTAARDLSRAGLAHIVVLEARDRVGGRSYTQDVGNGLYSDAGPTWIGPGQTAIQNLLRELEIGTVANYYKGDSVIYVNGVATRAGAAQPISDAGFFQRLNAIAFSVPIEAPWSADRAAEYDAMTFADYLAMQSLSDDDRLGLEIACQLTFGAKPQYLSFLYVLFYIHSAGGYDLLESMEGGAQQDRILGGTQAVPIRIAEELGSIVRLNQPVRSISGWNTDAKSPVRLETPDGITEARTVILALSPSQANEIRFTPALPQQRVQLMEHWPRGAHAIKIGVAYETPFWRAKGLSGQVYSPDGPFLWAMDVSPADGKKGQLMSFTLSADAPPKTSEQRKAMVIDVLAECLGPEALHPMGYVEHDWSQEDYTRGCVSPLAPGILTRFGTALRPANGRLIWAGTETSQIWMGYMDGAVRSGKNAALEALHSLAARR